MDGFVISIYIVIGFFGGIGAITVLIFVGSFVSKSVICSESQNTRQSTVTNQVREKAINTDIKRKTEINEV